MLFASLQILVSSPYPVPDVISLASSARRRLGSVSSGFARATHVGFSGPLSIVLTHPSFVFGGVCNRATIIQVDVVRAG